MPETVSRETELLLKSLDNKEKLVAILAPSFAVDFSFPEIIGQLKRLGFSYVVEVAVGAAKTIEEIGALIEKFPEKRFIASPCPGIIRLILNHYPQLIPYITPVASPMVQTAKIVQQEYPGLKIFFIGPCLMKKIEAKEDYPELEITALTYKELKNVLELKKITSDPSDSLASFDLAGGETRLFPVSGGLSQSLNLNSQLTDEEYDVVSGGQLVEKALEEFSKNEKLKFLDLLFCEGGCINGPGVVTDLPLKNRREKVIVHWSRGIK